MGGHHHIYNVTPLLMHSMQVLKSCHVVLSTNEIEVLKRVASADS
jgi:hypothetical protein